MTKFDNIREVPVDRRREAYAALQLLEAIEVGYGIYSDKTLTYLGWSPLLSRVWERDRLI